MGIQRTQPEVAGRAGTGGAWREIDQVVDELAALAESSPSVAEFHSQVLDRAVSTLAAVGGAVWTRGSDGRPNLAYQINLAEAGGREDPEVLRQHEEIALAALAAKQPLLVPPQSGTPGQAGPSNPSSLLLVLAAWDGEESSRGVLEVFQRPGTSPGSQRGYGRFLEVVCRIVADFHKNRQLADLPRLKEKWSRFERFSESVHRSLDLKETAYHVVNESRHFLACDRVWVATNHGRRCRVVAVSGVDTVNRRANVVRALERLCRAVVASGEPLWHDGAPQELAPELELPLRNYVDTAHVRSVAVVPLTGAEPEGKNRRSGPPGVLVVERFFAGLDTQFRSEVKTVCNHSQLALANAVALREIPFARALRSVGRVRGLFAASRLPLTLLAAGAIVAAAAALTFVHADFETPARGELQPVDRHHVFAPEDGVVSELKVQHGQDVDQGDVLMVLSKPELDVEFNRVWGELQTARKRLGAIEAERLQNRRDTEEQRLRHQQLTAEEEEVRELIASLEKQYEIVLGQQARMQIRSPIKGRVLSWNLAKRLKARPVARGQELLTVADLQGAWELELRVADRGISHVLAAREAIDPALDVSFILAMAPRQTHEGKVESVAIRTEAAERDGPFVPVRVRILDQKGLPPLVPGATARAKIYCGRRAIGYVWLHELFEAFQTWVAF